MNLKAIFLKKLPSFQRMGFFHVINQQSCVKTHCNLGLDASDSFLHAESRHCLAASVSFTLLKAPLKAIANARHIGKGCAMSIRIQTILLGTLVAGSPIAASGQDGFRPGAQPGQRAGPQASPPQSRGSASLDQMVQMERQDLGVPPAKQLHAGAMHGPTPASIPGGQVVTNRRDLTHWRYQHLTAHWRTAHRPEPLLFICPAPRLARGRRRAVCADAAVA